MSRGYLTEKEFFGPLFEDRSPEDVYATALMARVAMSIADKRYTMKMTQKEFAKKIGISQSMVSKCESGECNFTLQALARVFAKLELMPTLHVEKADGSKTLLHDIEENDNPDNRPKWIFPERRQFLSPSEWEVIA